MWVVDGRQIAQTSDQTQNTYLYVAAPIGEGVRHLDSKAEVEWGKKYCL